MTSSGESDASTDTREAIMEATFRALAKHGYSDLRMRDIGEELDVSRTLIHYHYDGKHDLISAFLEYIVDQYEGSVAVPEGADPWSELDRRIDRCLFGPGFDDEFGHWERMKVYHDLFSQAQYDERHREVFAAHYERIRGSIAAVIRRGVDEGVFRDVDADATAQVVTDLIHVARERRISLGQEDAPEQVRRAIDEFVLSSLVDAEFALSSMRRADREAD
ncbi:TetR/AcrR family transcriptional regulator [Candidatus Halobonum tyrrellensis]|uniref:Regulatory protein TetR n=1 Tax=Candidatus Halobonum tyrrellensis G22 TaxID=1324957 RepID=V4HQA6_9EURY|nr:TetR/AcrR family transcriptional regulator [Candidatus Halobonum tyrrellensis]ESP90099.1 regulatory protein TetR [Candidatus Halobonum tyrrellensis G22]